MSTGLIKLAPKCSFEAAKYAIHKTCILGKPDSGKTYTAMKVAEELMDNDIPIVVLDPVGVWQNLKYGRDGKKGYAVIVAGGENPDIPLTIESAEKIMRAALVNGISIIFDLYSVEMSEKSKWIKVLTNILKVLIYENKSFGSRHIFIEEASDFVPQVVRDQHAIVYGQLEKLTRIGRNLLLGITFINQRAASINKEILENCNNILLHYQDGKQSLKNIKDWMELMEVGHGSELTKWMSTLPQGECVVLQQKHEPVKIRVNERKTIHPNPEKPEKEIKKVNADVGKFIELMNAELQKQKINVEWNTGKKSKITTAPSASKVDNPLHEELQRLKGEVRQRDLKIVECLKAIKKFKDNNLKLAELISGLTSKIPALLDVKIEIPEIPMQQLKGNSSVKPHPNNNVPRSSSASKGSSAEGGSGSGWMRMLKAAKRFYPNTITRNRMGFLAELSPTSGTFGQYISRMVSAGFLVQEGKEFKVTGQGYEQAGHVEPLPATAEELIEIWCSKLGENNGMTKIFRVVVGYYPDGIDPASVGSEIGMSHTSGTFGQYVSRLRSIGLITKENGLLRGADEICTVK